MRCPSCGYVSFDYLTACKKCGKPLTPSVGFAPAPIAAAPSVGRRATVARARPREEIEEAPAFAEEFRPAGFWIRFVAAFVDGIVLSVLGILGLILVALPAGVVGALGDPMAMIGILLSLGLILQAVWFLVNIAYSVGFVGWRGQTPGKILLGVKIIRGNGDDVGYLKAFVRWIGQAISALPLMIGYIMAAFTQNKRALHDMIAGTRVIRL